MRLFWLRPPVRRMVPRLPSVIVKPTETADVTSNSFYYEPVLWALENGITSGMDTTHFGSTGYCNRAQVVTFLHRIMDK